jgi:hypothetical protein
MLKLSTIKNSKSKDLTLGPPRALRPYGNDRARRFSDDTLGNTSQKKSRRSFSPVRTHNNHIDAFVADKANDARPRPRECLDSGKHGDVLAFLLWHRG